MPTSNERLAGVASATAAIVTTLACGAVAGDVKGVVAIHGSSTVAPISLAVAEDFAELEPGFGYQVGEEGTGDGFSQFFCVDNSDISDASRAMSGSEAELCAANGVEYVELKVAFDGLAVLTSPANPIECVDFFHLYSLYGPESSDITTWEQAEAFARELGSDTDLPDGPVSITAPSTESGTYDSFVELVLEDIAEERGVAPGTRDPVPPYYVGSANDLVIIEGVAGSGSLTTTSGFVGLAYALEAGDRVKILAVDGGEGCVLPDATTVAEGSYPISRPLFIYPALNRVPTNPAIVPFVDFYLSDEGIANVADVGYVALAEEDLAGTRQAWEEAKSELPIEQTLAPARSITP